ncbi:DUF7196 family protein [Nocardia testacea]|uniref:DUF7196 family protein n=1 Tax=Nocardia testacea TaxID=248551 RepID=UPI003C2EFAC6
MGCGCGGQKNKPHETEYELTKPDGTKASYSSQVEARMQRSLAGGGTIRPVRKPAAT